MTRDKKIRAHGYAPANHNPPHLPGISLLGVMRTEPTSGKRTDYHHCTMGPQYGLGNDKGNPRSSIDGSSQEGSDRAHGMNITHSHHGEHPQGHEAYTCAEVSAKNPNSNFSDRLKKNRLHCV